MQLLLILRETLISLILVQLLSESRGASEGGE